MSDWHKNLKSIFFMENWKKKFPKLKWVNCYGRGWLYDYDCDNDVRVSVSLSVLKKKKLLYEGILFP